MEDIEGNISNMEIDLPIPEIFEMRIKERSKSESKKSNKKVDKGFEWSFTSDEEKSLSTKDNTSVRHKEYQPHKKM